MRIATIVMMAGLLAGWGCSSRNPDVTSAAGLTNTDLQQMVTAKLQSNPQLGKVDVDANAGRNQVTLSGSVPDEQSRTDAADLAKSARPDLLVDNKIEVKPGEVSRSDYTDDMARKAREKADALGDKIGQSLDDAWLYTKVKTKLTSDSVDQALKINVDVNNDVVTLRGKVDSPAAKLKAEQLAKETDGVKEVRNLLKVKS